MPPILSTMSIIGYLKQQHREIEELLRQVEVEDDDEERASLRKELADFTMAHITAENEVLTPALTKYLGATRSVLESIEEHHVVAFALELLMAVPLSPPLFTATGPTFSARLHVFKDVFFNHLEEEEDELLAQFEHETPKAELEQLGGEIERAFNTRLREGYKKIIGALLKTETTQTTSKKPAKKGKAAAKTKAKTKPKRVVKKPRS